MAGPMADAVIKRGYPVSLVRRGFQCSSLTVSSFCFVVFPHLDQVNFAIFCVCTILCMQSMSIPGFNASYVDVGGRNSGLLFSIGNMLATVAGIVSPLFGSWAVAATGSWAPLFYSVACVQLAAAALYWRCI